MLPVVKESINRLLRKRSLVCSFGLFFYKALSEISHLRHLLITFTYQNLISRYNNIHTQYDSTSTKKLYVPIGLQIYGNQFQKVLSVNVH